ncbi:MAG: hypothetical protein A2086_10780 [Spirochaetes bacterium GWD1_27_9]|nr:MAG: hypothetical protein A2Z98_18330 [Spirochaetes bacterium GWB1_27_13]OHD28275.1 MAG: hypothetical protein A2Y34_09665 [Spirochaetes bacterium GWC1_27_15]OHD35042.1 MAG: hypothetical protein A2086_10780 [Spirochaetes bacterium GWD1_27_9]
MPSNYLSLVNITPEEKQKHLFSESDKKLERIAKIIKSGQSEVEKCSLPVKLMTNLFYGSWLKGLHKKGGKFFIDSNCNTCKICEKICPVNNISIIKDKPQWSDKCEECYACFNFCPKMAIQVNKKSETQGRYHNPYVTINEIIDQK